MALLVVCLDLVAAVVLLDVDQVYVALLANSYFEFHFSIYLVQTGPTGFMWRYWPTRKLNAI